MKFLIRLRRTVDYLQQQQQQHDIFFEHSKEILRTHSFPLRLVVLRTMIVTANAHLCAGGLWNTDDRCMKYVCM